MKRMLGQSSLTFSSGVSKEKPVLPLYKQNRYVVENLQADPYELPANEPPKVPNSNTKNEVGSLQQYCSPIIHNSRTPNFFKVKADTVNNNNVTPVMSPRIPKPLYSPHPAAARSEKKVKDLALSTSSLALSRSQSHKNLKSATTTPSEKKKNSPLLPIRSSPRLKKMAMSSSAIPITALITPSELRRKQIYEQLTEFTLPSKPRSLSCISLHVPDEPQKHEFSRKRKASKISSRSDFFHSEVTKKRKLLEYEGTPVLPKIPKKSSSTSLRMSGKSMVDMRKAPLPVYVPPNEPVLNNSTPVKPKLAKKPSASRLIKKAEKSSPIPRSLRSVASSPNLRSTLSIQKRAKSREMDAKSASPPAFSTNDSLPEVLTEALVVAQGEPGAVSETVVVCETVVTAKIAVEPTDDFSVFENCETDDSEGYESASESLPTTFIDPQRLLDDEKYLSASEPLRMDSHESDYFSVASNATTPSNSIKTSRSKGEGVKFKDLKVFYFERDLGCTTVPENGEFSLGMKTEHFTTKKFSLVSPRKPNVTLMSVEEEPEEDEILHEDEEDCSMYTLNRIDAKQRVSMLRKLGVQLEKCGLEDIRKSRKVVGCNCVDGICLPETCDCSLNGIHCQVDGTGEDGRTTTPCGCDHGDKCDNPNGRSEFRRDVVQQHYSVTFQRIKDMERTGNFSSPKVTRFKDETEHVVSALHFDSIVRKVSYSSQSPPAISSNDEASSTHYPKMPSLL